MLLAFQISPCTPIRFHFVLTPTELMLTVNGCFVCLFFRHKLCFAFKILMTFRAESRVHNKLTLSLKM